MDKLVPYKPNPELLETVKVRFKGKDYWLVAETFIARGRLMVEAEKCSANVAEYYTLNWEQAYAVAYSDGDIVRHGKVIGNVSDLQLREKV